MLIGSVCINKYGEGRTFAGVKRVISYELFHLSKGGTAH
jgi:hypothetical protein